jgi:peptidoglycan/xylan/chitin deacetylase (PgdA/CDA1 family)
MLNVTTSWDDGDALDQKLAALLTRYGIKGTFYITKQYRKERLSDEEIRMLAQKHEIGAHTLTHPNLRALPYEKQLAEIQGSKQWLEEVLGKEVGMLCYPSGSYNGDSIRAAKEAGFLGARTIEFGRIDLPKDPYKMSTTVPVYLLPFRKVDANHFWWGKLLQTLIKLFPDLHRLGVPFLAFRSIEATTCAAFDIARAQGGVFHLWGHSWQIERYGMWEELERVLKYISKREDCRYMTNGEIIATAL